MDRKAHTQKAIDRFLHTPYYIIAVAVLSLTAHSLSAELHIYSMLIAIAVYTGFWGSDLLPLTPLFLFCYILPSAINNPGHNESSVFSGRWIIFIAIALGISIIVFLVRNWKHMFSGTFRLLPGMLVLCGAYMLSGIGSSAYPAFLQQNLLYCFLQCACLVIPYWLLSAGIHWETVHKNYLAWIGVCGGAFLLLQLLWCYITNGVIVDGAIVRTQIHTGWGMYNNIGAMLGMTLPFAFSLALSHKKDWLAFLVGGIFLIGILFTCSRASILAGILCFCICVALLIRYSTNRKVILVILACLAALLVPAYFVMRPQLQHLFSDLLSRGLEPHTRDEIYAKGWELFKEAPILGNSFFYTGDYPLWDFATVDAFSNLIPPRWCNTIVQLLVSAGLVGLIAYLVHRVDSILLLIRNRSRENSFIFCSIFVLIVTSLLDCHFFNLGPVLFYSAMLAFAEHQKT